MLIKNIITFSNHWNLGQLISSKPKFHQLDSWWFMVSFWMFPWKIILPFLPSLSILGHSTVSPLFRMSFGTPGIRSPKRFLTKHTYLFKPPKKEQKIHSGTFLIHFLFLLCPRNWCGDFLSSQTVVSTPSPWRQGRWSDHTPTPRTNFGSRSRSNCRRHGK